ncbi:hypothetical protein ONZ51_g9930 [Trametes cubensis]|uniref:RRM domain-containing protein n=1 Tax=Trametes cubensis TaxID=1111947 RepID=A0AAD7X6W8_9APHY|nr:hypothetical protein ONZ51_g9930 [Trametes cubensis]
MISHAQSSRLNNYHTHKQKILGNPSAQPAPAWKPNAKGASGSNAEVGSRIIISRLPLDVVENEVEARLDSTVGPVKDVFMVYNSQGRSRGMAVVTFARTGDAAVARAKYNGKIVDGRRPIKIELIVDEDAVRRAAPPAPAVPSLLDRLSGPKPTQGATHPNARQPAAQPGKGTGAATPAHNPKVRLRAKKGPRRLNKQRQQAKQPPKKKTAEELDREMEEYKARAEGKGGKAAASMEVA